MEENDVEYRYPHFKRRLMIEDSRRPGEQRADVRGGIRWNPMGIDSPKQTNDG